MDTWRTFDVRGERQEDHARAVVDVALEGGAGEERDLVARLARGEA